MELKNYDSADLLSTPEDIKEYLAASCQWNDPEQIAIALGTVARARNMAALARKVEMTREGLYRSFSEGGNPSLANTLRLANALGYTFALVPIEPIPDTADPSTRSAEKRMLAALKQIPPRSTVPVRTTDPNAVPRKAATTARQDRSGKLRTTAGAQPTPRGVSRSAHRGSSR